LRAGSAPLFASYSGGSGTRALVFSYTVRGGDNGTLAAGADLDLTDGATLKDADGFPARVTLTETGLAGVSVDTTPPSQPTVARAGTPSVSGTAEAGSTVTIYLDGVVLTTVAVLADGNWSFTLPANKAGTLTVSATDAAGNTSPLSTAITVNTFVPVANASSATVAYNSTGNAIPLNITSATPTNVWIESPPAHGMAQVQGFAVTYTPTTGYQGPDSFTYSASNANGTSLPATVTITVSAPSATAPVITLSTLSDGAVTSDTVLNVSGTIVATGGIASATLNGTALSLLPDGRFSYPVRLTTGANTITLLVTDKAGLSATATRTVTLDDSAPGLDFGQPSDGEAVVVSSLTVNGTVSFQSVSTDSLVAVTYTQNGGSPQPATVSNGAFSFAANLSSGLNTIEVTATTKDGKAIRAKRTVSLVPDLALAIVEPGKDMLVTTGQFVLHGKTSGTSVTLTTGTQTFGPTVSAGAFEQSLTLDASRVWTVQITATDGQGHKTTVLRNLVRQPTAFTNEDAYRALSIANGLVTATAADRTKYDVAPMVNGISTANGSIDIEDAAVVLWLASGRSL
jgi:hypothetical protein